MTRRALLIASGYYPLNTSGSHRPAKLAKYLPAFGWTPVVLCAEWSPDYGGVCYDPVLAAQPDVCRTVRVPLTPRPPTKLGRAAELALRILFPYRVPADMVRRAMAAAERLIAEAPFDVLWSTCWPGWTHHVAGQIARRHGIPWVADFRDLPDQDFSPWLLRYTVWQERRVCRAASGLTTVSEPLAEHLRSRHRAAVQVITNGYDPSDYPGPPAASFPTFNVVYTGILSAARDPGPLFTAVDRLLEAGAVGPGDVRIEFYGAHPSTMEVRLSGHRCRPIVRCVPRVSHAEAIRIQQQASVLLLLSERQPGVMTAKIFEYLGARRPILDVPGGDVTREVLRATRAGVSAGDPAEIARILDRWYREWKRTGRVAWTGDPDKVARYSRRGQAGQFAQIFDSLRRSRVQPKT